MNNNNKNRKITKLNKRNKAYDNKKKTRGVSTASQDSLVEMNRKQVREIQTSLKTSGYDLKVDGFMGQETASAIKKFQTDNELEPTGRLNEQTRTALMGSDESSY